jgi:hypothetical protein
MEAIKVDRTAAAAAEIATIRQQLAAAAARIQEKAKSTPTLDDLRERMADPPTLDAAGARRRALLKSSACPILDCRPIRGAQLKIVDTVAALAAQHPRG